MKPGVNIVQSVLSIIRDNPGLTYPELTAQIKLNKLKTNTAKLNILINDLILTNQIKRTNTTPKRYYLNLR